MQCSYKKDDVIVSIEFNDLFEPKTKRPKCDSSLADINKAIELRREEVKKHFEEANAQKFLSLKIENYKNLYISKYSPFIDIEFTYDIFQQYGYEKIFAISDRNDVNAVYIKPAFPLEKNEMFSALNGANLPSVYNIPNFIYDGSDVVIGVLEAGGVVDITNANILG